MNLKDIKLKIENCENIDNLIIFKYSDSDFIAHQYIHTYADKQNQELIVIDSLDQIKQNNTFFNTTSIFLYKTDKLVLSTTKYKTIKNLFIVCKSFDETTSELYKDCIIELPKLERWQILDYLYFNCPTVAKEYEPIISLLNNDMYAIDNEISKVSIFSKNKLEIDSCAAEVRAIPEWVHKLLRQDGALNYLYTYSIFDFVNALLTKDINKLNIIAKSDFKIVPVLFYQIIYSTVENIIKIVIDPTATAEKVNVTAGKFWAIKKQYTNVWSKEDLTGILNFLTQIDKQVKTGKLSFDDLTSSLIIENILRRY